MILLFIFSLLTTSEGNFFRGQYNKRRNMCTDCWCIPDEGPDGTCPDIGNRVIAYTAKDKQKFKSHRLVLSKFLDLPHLYPEGEEPKRIKSGPSCTPFPQLIEKVWLPPCEKPIEGKNDVCAFFYEGNDDNWGWGREYGMKTFPSYEAAVSEGAMVTHLGACGVCSNANDLAVFMDDDLNGKAESCRPFNWSRKKARECFERIGFTEDCAWLFATDNMYTSHECFLPCKHARWTPGNDLETCELNECNKCVEGKSGPMFELFSGRTRLNSGIVSSTTIKRKCSVIADIGQDPSSSPDTDDGYYYYGDDDGYHDDDAFGFS